MVKKTTPRKKRGLPHEIDHVPKCSQQPRSLGGSKRRTDFSFFVGSRSSSSSSSPSNDYLGKGLSLESLHSKSKLKNATITGLRATRDKRKETLKLPLARCGNSRDKEQDLLSNVTEVPIQEIESVAQNALSETWSDRSVDKQNNDIVRYPKCISDVSQVTESRDSCINPGSIVWARTSCQQWWPAEVMEGRLTEVDAKGQGIDQHVLIQFCGKEESAWVDPARDLSLFDSCFEERSSNQLEEFQDALKQALHKKKCLSSKLPSGSSDDSNLSSQHDQSHDLLLTITDMLNSSSSSRTDCAGEEQRRGKRIRKPKVHFDEVAPPVKSVRKGLRRYKIMRALGLAAPIGSPFALTR